MPQKLMRSASKGNIRSSSVGSNPLTNLARTAGEPAELIDSKHSQSITRASVRDTIPDARKATFPDASIRSPVSSDSTTAGAPEIAKDATAQQWRQAVRPCGCRGRKQWGWKGHQPNGCLARVRCAAAPGGMVSAPRSLLRSLSA
jgi:hypothetical protein